MQQITEGTAANHDVYVYQDGTLTDLDAAPTYAIVDAWGTAVASGTAASVATGIYRAPIPQQTEVALLTVTWTGQLDSLDWSADTELEVVGEVPFTIAELRAFNGGDLSSTSVYATKDLVEIRSQVIEEFAEITGVSFIPRYQKESLPGNGEQVIEVRWPRITSVLAATISGTSVTASSFSPLDERSPRIVYETGFYPTPTFLSSTNVTLAYRHGYERIPPEIKQAALILSRSRAIRNFQGAGVPYNATAWSDASGTYQAFAANDRTGRWYGIPEVDVPLRRFVRGPVF